MNRDEFKFLTINTQDLWEAADIKDGITITKEGIALEQSYSYGWTDISFDDMVTPVSLDLDSCGVLYILDNVRKRIYLLDLGGGQSFWVDCISFCDPKSIALTDSDVYVVHDGKISCLARTNYQIRWQQDVTQEIRIAAQGQNYLYVLDVDKRELTKRGRKWDFSPIDLKDKDGAAYQLGSVFDVASDQENSIYILETEEGKNKRRILKFDHRGLFIQKISIRDEEQGLDPCAIATDASGNILVGFEGTNRFVQRKKTKNYVNCGTYITNPLDSTIANCRWHKVVLDIDEDALKSTQVRLSYYASNEQEPPGQNSSDWSEPLINPRDALLNAKGRRIWFKMDLISDDLHEKTPLVKSLTVYFPRDSYLRYLPAVYQEDEKSRDFLERFLSLCETCLWQMESKIDSVTRYLDVGAAPDEFLAWLSSWLGLSTDENWPFEKRRELLKAAPDLFRKRGTREELNKLMEIYLEDPTLIKELQIYIDKCQESGTSKENLQGLRQLCEDAGKPIIVEHFQLKPLQELGLWARLFGNCPYRFCVLLKPLSVSNETELNTVRRIVQQHKPAHTEGGVVLLQPWLYLDMHTYLGINTVLTEPEFVLGKAAIGRDTVVADREQSGQIDIRARIGMDTILT